MKYTPHEYQQFCIDYLLAHPAAGAGGSCLWRRDWAARGC